MLARKMLLIGLSSLALLAGCDGVQEFTYEFKTDTSLISQIRQEVGAGDNAFIDSEELPQISHGEVVLSGTYKVKSQVGLYSGEPFFISFFPENNGSQRVLVVPTGERTQVNNTTDKGGAILFKGTYSPASHTITIDESDRNLPNVDITAPTFEPITTVGEKKYYRIKGLIQDDTDDFYGTNAFLVFGDKDHDYGESPIEWINKDGTEGFRFISGRKVIYYKQGETPSEGTPYIYGGDPKISNGTNGITGCIMNFWKDGDTPYDDEPVKSYNWVITHEDGDKPYYLWMNGKWFQKVNIR